MSEPIHQKFLTRGQAAHYVTSKWGIPLSKLTLDKWASVGRGPLFSKLGNRCFYLPFNLDNYFSKLTARQFRSTSEYATKKLPLDTGEDNEA